MPPIIPHDKWRRKNCLRYENYSQESGQKHSFNRVKPIASLSSTFLLCFLSPLCIDRNPKTELNHFKLHLAKNGQARFLNWNLSDPAAAQGCTSLCCMRHFHRRYQQYRGPHYDTLFALRNASLQSVYDLLTVHIRCIRAWKNISFYPPKLIYYLHCHYWETRARLAL